MYLHRDWGHPWWDLFSLSLIPHSREDGDPWGRLIQPWPKAEEPWSNGLTSSKILEASSAWHERQLLILIHCLTHLLRDFETIYIKEKPRVKPFLLKQITITKKIIKKVTLTEVVKHRKGRLLDCLFLSSVTLNFEKHYRGDSRWCCAGYLEGCNPSHTMHL